MDGLAGIEFERGRWGIIIRETSWPDCSFRERKSRYSNSTGSNDGGRKDKSGSDRKLGASGISRVPITEGFQGGGEDTSISWCNIIGSSISRVLNSDFPSIPQFIQLRHRLGNIDNGTH